jgi:hypothetical protein
MLLLPPGIGSARRRFESGELGVCELNGMGHFNTGDFESGSNYSFTPRTEAIADLHPAPILAYCGRAASMVYQIPAGSLALKS